MILKPPGCAGCPFQHAGGFFVPDEPEQGQRLNVLMQNPGGDEERGQRFLGWVGNGERYEQTEPAPAIGKTGRELDRQYLPLAGLSRDDVRVCNAVRCRVRGSNELPPVQSKQMREAIVHCQRAYPINEPAGRPWLALGSHALWALTGESGAEDEGNDDSDDVRANRGIVGWRGWTLPYRPQWMAERPWADARVFVTFHPAYYWRAHWMKPVGRRDFRKLGRWLRGEWPEAMPEMTLDMPARWPASLAYDTEYVPNGGRLLRVSLAWREADEEPRVHVVEPADIILPEGPVPHVIAHNMEADWPYVRRVFGVEPANWDDTMSAHSVLHGTLRHSLDFIGSLYARTDRWKHLEQSDELAYSGLDALATWDCWQQLARELRGDEESMDIYETELKPLMQHVFRRASIKLHAGRLEDAAATLARVQAAAARQGEAAAGWPLSVSSPQQVAKWIGVKPGKGVSDE